MSSNDKCKVLGVDIDLLSWERAVRKVNKLSEERNGKYICICNAHSIVTAQSDKCFFDALNDSSMATADGAPVAWLAGFLSKTRQERINGPDLMWKYLQLSKGASIFLYGSTPLTLEKLENVINKEFPYIKIVGKISPPFREMSVEEDEEIVSVINESGADTLWVSLGCPKQEKWMARHKGLIKPVMIGVGAAFNYHAGDIKRAPVWMQKRGLEWAHRLFSEPRRLWKRYLYTNSMFIIYAIKRIFLRRG